MNNRINRYQKLKNAARRLLIAGDVDRYMHALRLISGLRVHRPTGLA